MFHNKGGNLMTMFVLLISCRSLTIQQLLRRSVRGCEPTLQSGQRNLSNLSSALEMHGIRDLCGVAVKRRHYAVLCSVHCALCTSVVCKCLSDAY